MAVREAQPSDALGIATVHVRSWEATYRGLMPDSLLDQMTLERRACTWTRTLDGGSTGATFVATEGDRVVGFVLVGATKDTDLGPDVGAIHALYVDPDAWDAGHGRDLMVTALDRLRSDGCRAAILRVLETNTRGRSFYERGGWEAFGGVVMDDHCGALLPELRYRIDL